MIVPNFGAFIAEPVPARVDEEKMKIIPPSKKISFNSILKTNDGLLINHIAYQKRMTYQEAKNWLSEAVEDWNIILKEESSLVINGLGLLEYNENEKLIFKPSYEVNYLTSSYGLKDTFAVPIEQESTEPKEPVVIKKMANKSNYNWIKYAAAAIVGVSALGFSWKYQNDQLEYNQQKVALQKEVQTDVLNEIQQATFYLEAPKKTTKKEVVKPFHIIAAAFKTESKAEGYANELKEKGFPQAHFIQKESENDMNKVVYESFASEEEAREALQSIRKDNPEAWIFINN